MITALVCILPPVTPKISHESSYGPSLTPPKWQRWDERRAESTRLTIRRNEDTAN